MCNVNIALIVTYIVKKRYKDFAWYANYMIWMKVGTNLVQNRFLKIFGSVRWFQYLLEALKTGSDKVASVCTNMFRFELFEKRFSKRALLFTAP